MKQRRLFALVLFLFAPSFVAASMMDTTIVLDPVVVTATRSELARRSVPASVTVLSRDQLIATGATDALSAVAAATPGVFITQNDVAGFGLGPGSGGSISIRGVGGGTPNDQVLVLVDGQPQYTGLFGHPLPDAHALGEVERVEILRSPSSAHYGSGAMGGVVNIVTVRAKEPGDRISVSAQTGPWSTYDGTASASGRHGEFDYRLTVAHTTTDGHRDSSEFTRSHVSGLVGYRSGPWDVRLSGATTPFDGNMPAPVDGIGVRYIDVTRNSSALTATHRADRTTTTASLHYNWGYHRWIDWDSYDYVRGANLRTDYRIGTTGASISVGVEGRQYGGHVEGNAAGDVNVNEGAITLGSFIPVTDRARIIASGRVQWHEEYGWLLAPEAGATLDVLPTLTVRTAASRGFRDPSARDLYLFPPSNVNVDPETITNVEGGVIWRLLPSVVAEASVFRNSSSNVMELQAPPPAFVNTGSFTNYGTELEVRWVTSRVHGSVFTALHKIGDIESSVGSTIVTGSPERIVGVNTTLLVERVHLNASFQWVSGLYGDGGVKMDDYAVLNLSASRPIYKTVTGRIAVRNVLDTSYETYRGYPMPGRHVLAGLSAILER